MSYETEREAIVKMVTSVWDSAADGKVVFENQEFKETQGVFSTLAILNGAANRASMGGEFTMYRSTGVVEINIYAPKNTGTKKSREIAQKFADIYRDKVVHTTDGDVITFRVPELRLSGHVNDMHRHVLTCKYRRDEFLST